MWCWVILGVSFGTYKVLSYFISVRFSIKRILVCAGVLILLIQWGYRLHPEEKHGVSFLCSRVKHGRMKKKELLVMLLCFTWSEVNNTEENTIQSRLRNIDHQMYFSSPLGAETGLCNRARLWLIAAAQNAMTFIDSCGWCSSSLLILIHEWSAPNAGAVVSQHWQI